MVFIKPVIGEQLGLERITYVEEKAVYLINHHRIQAVFLLLMKRIIQIVKNGNTLRKPFLDISDQVQASSN